MLHVYQNNLYFPLWSSKLYMIVIYLISAKFKWYSEDRLDLVKLYLARHRLSIIEQIVFLHFPIFCLQLCCFSVLCIIQQDIYLTHRSKQTT